MNELKSINNAKTLKTVPSAKCIHSRPFHWSLDNRTNTRASGVKEAPETRPSPTKKPAIPKPLARVVYKKNQPSTCRINLARHSIAKAKAAVSLARDIV